MVITRFCPSNTGFFHLGSARTALYSYAYAKKMGGKCILRIEDTDRARSTKESLVDILSGLEWLGLKFDEGPSLETASHGILDKKYFQSQRSDIYIKYIDKLVQEDKAYIQDGATIFRMPAEDVTVHDLILGDVTYPAGDLKDFPIRRADGSVLFHACVVIDDALSGVTHIIRANDHLTNTPKHIQLFKAFGCKVPEYAHMPLILDDKGAKLSKRRTDQSVLIKDFRKQGILPETIINILGLLGWSPKGDLESFDLDYICNNFDIKDCKKANVRYDQKKMLAFNSAKLGKMPAKDFEQMLFKYQLLHTDRPFSVELKENQIQFADFAGAYHTRAKTLAEPIENAKFLVQKELIYKPEDIEKYLMANNGEGVNLLGDYFHHKMMYIHNWTRENIATNINGYVNIRGMKLVKLAQPLRTALTGLAVSPPIDIVMELLGKDKCVERITKCINRLVNV